MDKPTPERLTPHLAGTIFAGENKIFHFDTIGSTNAAALDAAKQGACEGTVFLAEEQTSGRGRGGHSWASPAGCGIYMSVVLRPELRATDVLWISLMTGLAVDEAIQKVAHVEVDLRWPNDIMAGSRKLGGILTEMATGAGRVDHLVIGIGLNVNQREFPAELIDLATSLYIESGQECSRSALVGALLQSLHREYQALQLGPEEATTSILRRFEERSTYARGARVYVEEGGGFTGISDGLDKQGFLRVQTPSGPRTVLSGGVRKL